MTSNLSALLTDNNNNGALISIAHGCEGVSIAKGNGGYFVLTSELTHWQRRYLGNVNAKQIFANLPTPKNYYNDDEQ